MSEYLKPCPFCGGEAKMIQGDGGFFNRVQIDCGTCRNATWWWDYAVAVRSWNKRVSDTPCEGAKIAESHIKNLREGAKNLEQIARAGDRVLGPIVISMLDDIALCMREAVGAIERDKE